MIIELFDGNHIDCEDRPFDFGSVGRLYYSCDHLYVIKLYKTQNSINRQALEILTGHREQIIRNLNIAEMICWPIAIIDFPTLGVLIPTAPTGLTSLNWFVRPQAINRIPETDRGNWSDRVHIAIKICQIIEYLHSLRMIITDIVPRNFLVALPKQQLYMLDCDGIVMPGTFSPHVIGSPEYQAPEIIMGGNPSIEADLHSLSVTLYRLLFLRHPLLGPKVYSEDQDTDERMSLGEMALFIEHPRDQSNRPIGLGIKSYDFGDEMYHVILRAFVDGLHHPEKRPSATEWLIALNSLTHKLRACTNSKCSGKYSIPRIGNDSCYWCGAPYEASEEQDVIKRMPKTRKSRSNKTPHNIDFSEQVDKVIPISKGETKIMVNRSQLVKILFLAADPTDASRLRLGEEFREIQEKLKLAKLRDRFMLELPQLSIRPPDISQALLDVQPNIVHFSGHGTSSGELCFEDQLGRAQLIQPDALAALFEQFANSVQCILLNACYSEAQAKAIAKHIQYVIGMNKAIGDEAAIAFAIGFYQALGAGRTIEDAYKLGCVQIRLQGISEHLTPILIKKV